MVSNAVKAEVLGEPFGTASHKLRKSLLFDAIGRLGERNCYQCGNLIEKIEEFSIEHKQSWMRSGDPIGSFYSLENISYSHVRCNVAAAHRPNKVYKSVAERSTSGTRKWRENPDNWGREKDRHNELRRKK